MNELVLIDEDNEIKKSEILVRSRYKLKPLAIKLITSLISAVQDKDTPEQEYIFSVSNFVDLAELKGKAYYKELEKAAEELFKPFKINQNGKDWDMVNWVRKCKYRHGTGTISFQIHEDILPLIKNLKKGNYLKYDLSNILRLRGEYSIRIYEMLKDVYNINARYGKSASEIYTIQYLRDAFNIPKSYRYHDIKRVILVSQENLLKYTDIKFDFEEIKVGRAVHSLKFKIYPNPKNIKKEVKLPAYLDNFISYVNYLREKYKNTSKYFLVANFEVNSKKQVYFFAVNKDEKVFAVPAIGGHSVTLSKGEAQTIYNLSYLCSKHSEIYRYTIENEADLWDIKLNDKDFFDVIIQEIKEVLREHDPKQPPLI
jgi:plasmid replication initiation protein